MNTVVITDVTLRDGLQMESRVLPVAEKSALLSSLLKCGYARIEVTSFVHPKWMPQFADAEALASILPSAAGCEFMAFVPNERGLARLIAHPIPWAAAFVSVSESFNQKNINTSVDATLLGLAKIVEVARANARKVRIYISTAFGCPYEGEISLKQFENVFARVAKLDPDEITVSDTIGVAYPEQVIRVVDAAAAKFSIERIGLHFHNTYGLAIACAEAGYGRGVRIFDGATGGTGGCPYAKGASGNVASEDLRFAFARAGRIAPIEVGALEKVYGQMERSGLPIRSQLYEVWKCGGKWYDGSKGLGGV